MDQNIKFTIEIENNNELSFLDVTLIKNLSKGTIALLISSSTHRRAIGKYKKLHIVTGDIAKQYILGLFEKLRHALFRFGVNLIATPPAKLKNLISVKIDPIPKDEVSGVYIIPLKTENIYLEYIGMTSRKLKVRIKEHLRDLKYSGPTTALSRLNQKQNIQVYFEDAKIIYPSKNYPDLIIRESIEIINKENTVFNDVLSCNIPRSLLSLLKES